MSPSLLFPSFVIDFVRERHGYKLVSYERDRIIVRITRTQQVPPVASNGLLLDSGY